MTTENKVFVPWDMIGDFMVEAFQGYGVPAEDAKICADVLMEADRLGIDSHGCNRFKPIYLDRIRRGTLLPKTEIEVLKETPTTLVYDAHDGMGMVASYKMMTELIAKAKKYGMAGGAIRNSTHYGIASYWTRMASNAGKIELWARSGKDTPEGCVICRDGSTMTDSEAILEALVNGQAALTPVGGVSEDTGSHKGYGWAATVEILSAALTGGQFMKALTGVAPDGSNQMYHLGHFFFVIDPEAFMGLETFRKTAGDICRGLRNSEVAPGKERIYTAGEKEHIAYLERKDKGVPVGPSVQAELIAVRDELGLDYKFPFEQ